ncbi:hypothetical protein CERZMDRAFT_83332 [Cercospora zeae-maydis SCOH1-5]|uniref:Uncharacterized protein n=1 Tax=Cercospora zeae-maydis SCOH1-5 TaxID=717836 RepID=A0A6A6FKC3_9PEZI|nr:hypothetical protein CERZMDRAFT_83332 [Cercospora zeae-maydis SCOH1-5]
METESSTLSAYTLVLAWINAECADSELNEALARAISYDIQTVNVLLQHVVHLNGIWNSSWPSLRLQRRRLYITDLKPRVEADLWRIDWLIRIARSELGIIRKDQSLSPTFTNKDNITIDLLLQAQRMLSLLLSEIDALPDKDRHVTELLIDEILERDDAEAGPPVAKFLEEDIGRPNVTLRIPELEAKQILMKKPTKPPALVQCTSRCNECGCRPCRCWAKKRVQRNDSMFSLA